MVNWFIKKIKNDKTDFDFRLKNESNTEDYSKINFKSHDIFRMLVSLSTHLTNGIIKDNLNFYKILYNKDIPAIFDFKLIPFKNGKNESYMTISNNMKTILN